MSDHGFHCHEFRQLEAQIRRQFNLKNISTTEMSRSANRLKPQLIEMTFNNSVRTAKKTQHFTVTKINRLTAV
jgi:hypothetical protein